VQRKRQSTKKKKKVPKFSREILEHAITAEPLEKPVRECEGVSISVKECEGVSISVKVCEGVSRSVEQCKDVSRCVQVYQGVSKRVKECQEMPMSVDLTSVIITLLEFWLVPTFRWFQKKLFPKKYPFLEHLKADTPTTKKSKIWY